MANYILLVFEGEKTERLIFESFTQFYFQDLGNTVIYGVYCGEIYSLYHKMSKDPDLDLFSIIKERQQNKDRLAEISKDDVSEIFLFFDYDGHAPAADDEIIRQMLEHFNEETENGRLYLSYPMVEAFKHLSLSTQFSTITAKCKEKIGYKGIVHHHCDSRYKNSASLTKDDWGVIISEHCKKLNHLMVSSFSLPEQYFDQPSVFGAQLEKHITPRGEVSVLSAFPVFIADYYGHSKIQSLIEPEN